MVLNLPVSAAGLYRQHVKHVLKMCHFFVECILGASFGKTSSVSLLYRTAELLKGKYFPLETSGHVFEHRLGNFGVQGGSFSFII